MDSVILQRLHQDHINIARVAALIETMLLDVETGLQADYGLLEEIMTYVTGYPDVYPHPAEDFVFDRLKQTTPEAAAEVDAWLGEHVDLIASGRIFLDIVRAVEEESVVERADFLARGRKYLAKLRAHMSKEEAGLFRLAAERLGSEDWVVIQDRIEATEDPLFGPTVAADFRRLWQRITAHDPAP
jgi:hemerythrin-like domain-containing protein